MLVAALSSKIQDKFDSYGRVSSLIGPSISAGFLLLIGIINGVSIYLIVKDLKKLRESDEKVNWNSMLENGGFFSRICGKTLFRVIDAPYKMYFIGFLFGLGFDTATEVALLGMVLLGLGLRVRLGFDAMVFRFINFAISI
jgi:high-affinity nickel-transport protein